MNIAYNMDCLAAMREMPDNAFDLAVVDPPYGIGITNTAADDSQSVHVEREREPHGHGARLAAARPSAVKIGGGNLSRPKATTRLMTTRRQMRNTFPNSNG